MADQTTPYTETVLARLQDAGAMVPAIWPLEVANVLLVAGRRGRLAAAQTVRLVEILRALPITVDDGALTEAWGPVLALAREQGLSAYDASYLALAMRQGLPLATQDARLSAAAMRSGMPLVR